MNPRTRAAILAGIFLGAALLVGATLGQRGMGAGMMGFGSGYGAKSLDWAATQQVIAQSSRGASIDSADNTVTFSGARITLDIIAVQPDKPDTTFEIAGLINPTVVIPRGSLVTIDLVNMDYGADMPHGLVITRFPPPYPYMAMPMMSGGSTGIPPLKARSSDNLKAATYAAGTVQFRATTPGTYYYLCQVPGHAQKGMYGTLIVQ